MAKVPGASGIENMDEPGGGKRVRLTEPNGYQIEVVWGMKEVPRSCRRRARCSTPATRRSPAPAR